MGMLPCLLSNRLRSHKVILVRHPKNIQKQTPFSQLLGSVQPFNSYFDQLFGLVSQAAFLSPFPVFEVRGLSLSPSWTGWLHSQREAKGDRRTAGQASKVRKWKAGGSSWIRSAHFAGKDGEWLAKSHFLVFSCVLFNTMHVIYFNICYIS